MATQKLTHMEMLRDCAKKEIMINDLKPLDQSLCQQIQSLIDKWMETNKADRDYVLGFVFPQTDRHEPLCVLLQPMRKPRQVIENMTDAALKHVCRRIIQTYEGAAVDNKSVSWTWPVLETYIHRFYHEVPETKSHKTGGGGGGSFRLLSRVPPKSKVVANVAPSDEPAFVLCRIDICPLLNQMYNLLVELRTLHTQRTTLWLEKQDLKRRIMDGILDSGTENYKETVAIERQGERQGGATTKHTTCAIQFSMQSKPAHSRMRIPLSNYVSCVRVKETKQPTDFVGLFERRMEGPIEKHPFYQFLRSQLDVCRQETYKLRYPLKVDSVQHTMRVAVKKAQEKV